MSFFFLIWAGPLRFDRWMIPIFPFEALFAGVGTAALLRYAALRKNAVQKTGSTIIVLIVAGAVCLISAVDVLRGIKLSRTDTRTIAKQWIEQNLPEHARIANEAFGPPLDVLPKKKFELLEMGWKGIASEPLDHYKNRGIRYVILTGWLKDQYSDQPAKYPIENERYRQIRAKAVFSQTFDNKRNPGPTIEIHQLS